MITTIYGLDTFGVQLKEAAKLCKKKFACGSAVVENPGVPDAVEIQGDPGEDEVRDFICSKFPEVDRKKFTFERK